MKAIQITAFGGTDVLQLKNITKPAVNENEVLIRISATTVNPLDMKIRSGMMQAFMPVDFPFTPGLDFAGTIEETGSKVTRVKPGDQVYGGTHSGTYAEYIALDADYIDKIPQNVTVNEAASLVIPLHTAYSFLISQGKVQKGQSLLIHGAAGAVGQVMVQMAKELGAYVIGTASGEGIDLLKSLGADEAIDYKQQDFSEMVRDADLVIDLIGGETQTKSFAVLKKGGLMLSAIMPPSEELAKEYGVNARFADAGTPSYEQLAFEKRLVEQGKIKPRVARVMKLEDAAAAQDLVSAGGLNGKVVLEVD